MKAEQLLEILEEKAKIHWADEKGYVAIEIKFNTYSRRPEYNIFSLPTNFIPAGSDEKRPPIMFKAKSVSECIKVFEQKTLGIKNNEQIDLD